MRLKHVEVLRLGFLKFKTDKNIFFQIRVEQMWLAKTKKSQGTTMGKGKGNIKSFVYPIKSGRIIGEVTGNISYQEIRHHLRRMATCMPFKCRVVTREFLDYEKNVEEYLEEKNINPFSFRKCSQNNYKGIRPSLGHYDLMFDGKFR